MHMKYIVIHANIFKLEPVVYVTEPVSVLAQHSHMKPTWPTVRFLVSEPASLNLALVAQLTGNICPGNLPGEFCMLFDFLILGV